jgi:hypothetical protein
MSIKYFDFSDDDIEGLDDNELFKLSLERILEFSPNKLLEFINDTIIRLDCAMEGYYDASSMTPSDVLSAKNLSRSIQTLTFVEHWVKNNVDFFEEEDIENIISNDEDL